MAVGAAAVGDLSAVDDAAGLFWYLGDTSRGTTLVALNMSTGDVACSTVVSGIEEVTLVGLGQSLDFDPTTSTLVLSGVASADPSQHVVYRADAGGCEAAAAFELLGTFGLAAYLPLLHASALDPEGQRLFVQLSASDGSSTGIGAIPLDGGAEMDVTLVPEGTLSSMVDYFLGFTWDGAAQLLHGIVPGPAGGLELRSLEPDAAAWSSRPLLEVRVVQTASVDAGTNTADLLSSTTTTY